MQKAILHVLNFPKIKFNEQCSSTISLFIYLVGVLQKRIFHLYDGRWDKKPGIARERPTATHRVLQTFPIMSCFGFTFLVLD